MAIRLDVAEMMEKLMAVIVVCGMLAPGGLAVDCGAFSCPNFMAQVVSNAVGDGSNLAYCCQSPGRGPYCCDWKDKAANVVGLDPHSLGLPVGAIIGIVVGGVVLMVLFCVCCCFCCGLCCFRGRKRTITQHHTVAFGKVGRHA